MKAVKSKKEIKEPTTGEKILKLQQLYNAIVEIENEPFCNTHGCDREQVLDYLLDSIKQLLWDYKPVKRQQIYKLEKKSSPMVKEWDIYKIGSKTIYILKYVYIDESLTGYETLNLSIYKRLLKSLRQRYKEINKIGILSPYGHQAGYKEPTKKYASNDEVYFYIKDIYKIRNK